MNVQRALTDAHTLVGRVQGTLAVALVRRKITPAAVQEMLALLRRAVKILEEMST